MTKVIFKNIYKLRHTTKGLWGRGGGGGWREWSKWEETVWRPYVFNNNTFSYFLKNLTSEKIFSKQFVRLLCMLVYIFIYVWALSFKQQKGGCGILQNPQSTLFCFDIKRWTNYTYVRFLVFSHVHMNKYLFYIETWSHWNQAGLKPGSAG